MKQFKSIFLILTIMTILFSMGSCGQLDEGEGASYTVKDIPGTVKLSLPIKWDIGKIGGTWRGVFGTEIKSFNPFASLEGTAYTLLERSMDFLFDYDYVTREWKGFLVKNFEVKIDKEKDTMELYCTLRDDVFWSDGVQMTADDVVYFFTELDGDPEISPRGYLGHQIKMDDGTEKPIQIEKISKFEYKYIFPRIIANPVLSANSYVYPKHIWEPAKKKGKDAVMALWGINTPPEQIVGNGPFLLEEYKPAERLVLKRNPNYWRKDEQGNRLPYIDKIVLTYIPTGNSSAELLKFQKGDVESYGLRGVDMAALLPDAEEKGYDIWNMGPAQYYTGVIFNQRPTNIPEHLHKLFADKRFRHAVSSCIDRETMIDQAINGFAVPFYHFISETNKYYNPKVASPYQYNIEKAKEILAEINLKDTNGDNYLEDKEGNTIEFKILMYGNDQITIDINNMIIDNLKAVGLKATLEIVDVNVYIEKKQFTHDWQCSFSVYSFPVFPEQWYNVWPSNGDYHYWYPSQKTPATDWEARIDQLYGKIIHTYEESEMRELYTEFQSILMEQLPIIPVYRKYSFTAVYKKWGNVNTDALHTAGDTGGVRLYLKEKMSQ